MNYTPKKYRTKQFQNTPVDDIDHWRVAYRDSVGTCNLTERIQMGTGTIDLPWGEIESIKWSTNCNGALFGAFDLSETDELTDEDISTYRRL